MVALVSAEDVKELKQLLARIKQETWQDPEQKRNVITGIIIAMGTLRAAHLEAIRKGAAPHILQPYSDKGMACHYPYCAVPWEQHAGQTA